MFFDQLKFANSGWIHATWTALLITGVLIVLEIRNRNRLNRFMDPAMQARLARTTTLGQQVVSRLFWFAGLVSLVVALMRPQFGLREESVPYRGAQIMVAVDVSRSMLAEDATPSRLERAKSELQVLLNYLDSDQVGLIAFAGKATVLSPLTTDFNFLKMVLRETGPTSVGRGGTMLEAPIRRAMAGFADTSNMSRVIILITDGEDNGSKPLDAARNAAERGITIITIGFGDQAGTRIRITDPETGLTDYVRDASGQPVVSRLDVDLLTRIAAETNGAYIPAGTGSLDLEGIYQDHIQPLMRANSETRQFVRNESFQIPLVVGLGFLLIASLISHALAFSRQTFGEWLEEKAMTEEPHTQPGHGPASRSGPSKTRNILPLVISGILGGYLAADAPSASATMPSVQQEQASPARAEKESASESTPEESAPLGAEMSSSRPVEPVPNDPVACYNLSLDVLKANPDYAEKLLEAARKNAGRNAELRYRSAYNLGWVKINRADELLQTQPEEALSQLQSAAGWFREAVRLRPKDPSARKNLEIVLRRATELSDSLQKSSPAEFAEELDRLTERQNEILSRTRELLERTRPYQSAPELPDDFSKPLRLLSVDQRILNSDLQDLLFRVSRQLESDNQPSATQSSQRPGGDASLERAQLQRGLSYVQRALQRLGQARTQLRIRNPSRAAMRSALGVDELERARDQLRDPADVLRGIIGDTRLLRQQTAALQSGDNLVAAFLGGQSTLPLWLNVPLLQQFQSAQRERTEELATLIKSAAEEVPDSTGEPGEAGFPRIGFDEAGRLLDRAAENFVNADAAMQDSDLIEANKLQLSALKRLLEAYEVFADLTGLIELAHSAQEELDKDFGSAQNLSAELRRSAGVTATLWETQSRNARRVARIDGLLQEQDTEVDVDSASSDSNSSRPERVDPAKLQKANELVAEIELAMDQILESLKKVRESNADDQQTAGVDSDADWEKIVEQSNQATAKLDELRQMFLSVVERLKATAERQRRLNQEASDLFDRLNTPPETADSSAEKNGLAEQNPDSQRAMQFGPLRSRQEELGGQAAEITEELKKQRVDPDSQNAGVIQAAENQQQQTEQQQKIRKAARLVAEAKEQMEAAASGLDEPAPESGQISGSQSEALTKLLEALNQLASPQDSQGENKDPQNQPQSGQSDDSKTGNSPQEDELEGDAAMNRILQGVRDREAQRRRNQQRRGQFREQVEKDW